MSNEDAFLLSLYGGCLCSTKSVLASCGGNADNLRLGNALVLPVRYDEILSLRERVA